MQLHGINQSKELFASLSLSSLRSAATLYGWTYLMQMSWRTWAINACVRFSLSCAPKVNCRLFRCARVESERWLRFNAGVCNHFVETPARQMGRRPFCEFVIIVRRLCRAFLHVCNMSLAHMRERLLNVY